MSFKHSAQSRSKHSRRKKQSLQIKKAYDRMTKALRLSIQSGKHTAAQLKKAEEALKRATRGE